MHAGEGKNSKDHAPQLQGTEAVGRRRTTPEGHSKDNESPLEPVSDKVS